MSDITSIEETVENPKHGGGRPKDKVWQYYNYNPTKHAGHYDARCKFCDTY